MSSLSRVVSGVVVAVIVVGAVAIPGAATAAPGESVTVSGRVFDDTDADGVFDAGEPVFPGVAVQIMDSASETLIADPADPTRPWTITTDADGVYVWDVPPLPFAGYQYAVKLTAVPTGYQGNGGGELPDGAYVVATTKDLNAAGATDDAVHFPLTTKAAARGPVVFGGAVWEDLDRNGSRDAGEAGLAGLIVRAQDQDGNRLDDPGNPGQPLEAVTEDDGTYRFDTLPYLDDGQFYTVALSSAPAGMSPTSGQVSDGHGGYTRTGTVPLTAEGATDLGFGFGFARVAGVTVSGAVFVDADRSGTRDRFERPLPGLRLEIRAPGGEPMADAAGAPVTASTDETGSYRFSELPTVPAGQGYRIVLADVPAGYESSAGLTETDGHLGRDSTADLSATGASDAGVDFALARIDGSGSDGDWLVMPDVHADVLYPELAPTPDGKKALTLRAHVDGIADSVDWNDTVIHHTDGVKEALPAANVPGADYSFIGPPGSMTWRSWQSGPASGRSPWIGLSTQSPSLDVFPANHPFVFRVDAVIGPDGGAAPGDVVIWQNNVATGDASPDISTLQGFPQALAFGKGKHAHYNWSFTAPGVYCMAVSASTDMPDGSRQEARGFLTQIVGSAFDPSTIEPCGRQLAYPTPPVQDVPSATDPAPVVWDNGESFIGVSLDRGALSATVNRSADRFDAPAVAHSIDDVIAHSAPENTVNGRYSSFVVDGWNTLGMPADALRGHVEWRIDEARGPGNVSWSNGGEYADQSFDVAAGRLTQRLAAGAVGNTRAAGFSVTRPGLYCLDMSWSATTAAGEVVSDAHTLTLVVDGPLDPNGYDPVWKSHGKDGPFTGPVWRGAEKGALEKTCAQGAVPTRADQVPIPGSGGDPEPDGPVWQVPNWSRTESGAVILNLGHLDVASTLNGGVFDTQVKDTTAEGVANATRDGASWHDPSAVVMQLLPGAETTIPADEKYRFLGAAGAPVWVVTETQQNDLVWPGWSTEAIPVAATTTGVDWQLDRVSGPGEFALSKGGSALGSVEVLMNTRDGIGAADRITIPRHSHVHGDWSFSAEGTYCLGFTRSTTLAGGSKPSDTFTLAVAVGKVSVKKIDPATCFTGNGQPAAPDTTPVPESQLTDAAGGGVHVFGNAEGFLAGQLVTVETGGAAEGSWVSVWVHSVGARPVWAGWARVNSAGAAQVRLPETVAVGSHKLVLKDESGVLIGWDAIAVVAPPTAAPQQNGGSGGGGVGGGPVPASAAQCTPTNVAVIGAGHLDWNAQLVGGKLESLIGDDSTGSRVYRDPASTVLWLKPASKQTLPGGYGQVGPAGATVWQNPQTQNPDLIWLGWSTELLNAGNAASGVSWSLDAVDGPGTVKVYTASSFGGVQTMYFDGGGGSFRIPLGVHAHANWAFTAEGIYRLRFTQTVTLPNGQASSDTETLTIAVGDVNPQAAISSGGGCGVVSTAIRTGTTSLTDAATSARQAQAEAAAAAAEILPNGRSRTEATASDPVTPFAALAAGDPVPVLLSILGGLLLVGAAGTGALWWRRRGPGIPNR